MSKLIKEEIKDSVLVLTIDREEALNALNKDLLNELLDTFKKYESDAKVKAVLLTGKGKAFVAGADIAYMKDLNADQGREFGRLGSLVFDYIENFPKPVIAAVNGFALGGGCELALSCDIRLASVNAKFGQPEVGLGITPGFSGTVRLTKLLGKGIASHIIFSGDILEAGEALKIGLVEKVIDAENFLDEVFAYALKIIKNAPLALKYSKSSIINSISANKSDAIKYENEVFGICFSTEDQKNGMEAFLKKEKPKFSGK